jgi:hypothetical protein
MTDRSTKGAECGHSLRVRDDILRQVEAGIQIPAYDITPAVVRLFFVGRAHRRKDEGVPFSGTMSAV